VRVCDGKGTSARICDGRSAAKQEAEQNSCARMCDGRDGVRQQPACATGGRTKKQRISTITRGGAKKQGACMTEQVERNSSVYMIEGVK
jgi:hypothetical protein